MSARCAIAVAIDGLGLAQGANFVATKKTKTTTPS